MVLMPITAELMLDDSTKLAQYHAALQQYQQLFNLWEKSSKSRRATTREDYWKVLQSFADFVERKPIAQITRKDIVNYRDSLLESALSATTASRKISILKTLFVTAQNYELIEHNPADSVRTQTTSQRKQRIAFSTDDLNRIFKSNIYTAGFRPKGAGIEAVYWLPLLALFTGARVEELAQLLVGDIKFVEGLGHYLNITDDAEHSHLKNTASRRRIPVHPILIACGFTDYAQGNKPSQLLFPHLKPNPRGKLGGYFSNFFSSYLRNTIGITDSRKVFHSFRHTFKDTCRKVGIEEAVHDALTGHTAATAGRKYGNEQYPLEPLFEAIERYEVAGLDLSHLYKRPFVRRLRPDQLKMISVFYGIVVAFAASTLQRNKPPFVIAIWQSTEAAIDIGTNQLLWGQLPTNKLLLVNAWIEIHREELLANWHAGRLTGDFFKLDPLR